MGVLFITAHPDDELLFFGGVLLWALRASDVFLWCLSDGGYDSDGSQRRIELQRVCERLHIHLLQASFQFRDGPHETWDPELIRNGLTNILNENGINCLFTFGPNGQSGHPNHKAIWRALEGTNSVAAFKLGDVPLCFRYTGKLYSITQTIAGCEHIVVYTSLWTRLKLMRLFALHKSQNTLVRRVFMVLRACLSAASLTPL